jgi:hypothetical protein
MEALLAEFLGRRIEQFTQSAPPTIGTRHFGVAASSVFNFGRGTPSVAHQLLPPRFR